MSSTLFVLAFFIYTNRLVHSDTSHALCKPRLTLIQVDKQFTSGDYWPFFIQVHRCGGSCYIHPNDQKCAPLTSDTIKIPLYDRENAMKQVFVTIKNHTSCGCACVKSAMDCKFDLEDWKEDQCRCSCRYSKEPPKDLACKPGFRWDNHQCRCKCDQPPTVCPSRKEWNKEACGCTCSKRVVNRCERKMKGLDYERCECVDVQALRRDPSTQSKSGLYTSIFIVLGVIVIALVCVVVHLIIKLKQRPRSITYSEELPGSPSKNPPSMADSGNMSYSNGSVSAHGSDVKANYQTDSNGSVHLSTPISRESTL